MYPFNPLQELIKHHFIPQTTQTTQIANTPHFPQHLQRR